MAHASHLQSDEKGILKEIPLQLFHENTFLLFIERKERNISVQNIQEKNKDLFFLSTSPTSIKGGGGWFTYFQLWGAVAKASVYNFL